MARTRRGTLDLGAIDPGEISTDAYGYGQLTHDLTALVGRPATLLVVLDTRPGRAGTVVAGRTEDTDLNQLLDPATISPTGAAVAIDTTYAEPRIAGRINRRITALVVTEADGARCQLDWDQRPTATAPGGHWVADAVPLIENARLRSTVGRVLDVVGPAHRPSELAGRLLRIGSAVRSWDHDKKTRPTQEQIAEATDIDPRQLQRDVAAWWLATHPGEPAPTPAGGGLWGAFMAAALAQQVN